MLTAQFRSSPLLRYALAISILLLILWPFSQYLQKFPTGHELVLSLWFGTILGICLQRSRFCFYCLSRDFIEQRDARGLLGIIAALALGTAGYHGVFGAFLPEPSLPRLPPDAHIGPVSWVLAVGAFVFGLGMAIAGSCISAQLYRLGEGLLSAPIALLGTLVGFVLGFYSWNFLYLHAIQQAPVLWLPHYLGYAGSLLVQLGLLAVLAIVLFKRHRQPLIFSSEPWWKRRWPTYAGALIIGGLATVAFLRVAPLGVTAELGSIARTMANYVGILPTRIEGLDSFRGCATVIKSTLWSNNGVFIVTIVLGSLISAVASANFRLQWPTWSESGRVFMGGILMGWGAMVGLGCTIGTLLSGIMAAAVSGWVFALFAGFGLYAGWWLRYKSL